MESINSYELIAQLIRKTSNKQVNWLLVREDEFKVLLKSGAITISKSYDTKISDYCFTFKVYNSKGDSIFDLSLSKMNPFNPAGDYIVDLASLEVLFNEARSSYFKVNETVNQILNELSDDSKEVGATKDDFPPTDLPF